MTEAKKLRLRNKIIESRTRLTEEKPYFAVLLMYLHYAVDDNIRKVSTNGRCIFFSSDFLEKLYPTELDFVLCHLALHIALGHIWRQPDFKGETYHHACDIVVNSVLNKYGFNQKKYPHLGSIYKSRRYEDDVSLNSVNEVLDSLLYTVESFDERTKARLMFDSDYWWDYKNYSGKYHEMLMYAFSDMEPIYKNNLQNDEETEDEEKNKEEKEEYDEEAADKKDSGTDKTESNKLMKKNDNASETINIKDKELSDINIESEEFKREWEIRVGIAEKVAEQLSKGMFGIGCLADYAERKIGKSTNPIVDWKEYLKIFIQEQVCDYSFMPPDKRYAEYDFFLPDFNEKETLVRNILFMVDTSGSFNDDMIAMAYSEIEGAINQFGGLLCGKIGFFDTKVHCIKDISSVSDLKKIVPVGGGGTDFHSIFDYIKYEMKNDISSLIVLTDGYGDYPENINEKNYPILWIINNNIITPPYGRVVRII